MATKKCLQKKVCDKKKASQRKKWSGQIILILLRNVPHIIQGFHTEMLVFQIKIFVEHDMIEFESKN